MSVGDGPVITNLVSHESPLTDLMTELDDNQEALGSGLYVKLAKMVKDTADKHEADKEADSFMQTVRNVAQMPCIINSNSALQYGQQEFFYKMIVAQVRQNMKNIGDEYGLRLRSMLTSQWKELIVREMLNTGASMYADTYSKLRLHLYNLFVMRIGILPLVLKRLQALGLTPHKLFPHFFGIEPAEGDKDGLGPGVRDILKAEPRMLRWMVNANENAPWPTWLGEPPPWFASDPLALVAPPRSMTLADYLTLISLANEAGGDDPSINSPCDCSRCKVLGLRTMPNNQRQANFVSVYKDVNTWPVTNFPARSAIDDPARAFKPNGSIGDKCDTDTMLNHCRDPKHGMCELGRRSTRSSKRKLLEDHFQDEDATLCSMESDLVTLPAHIHTCLKSTALWREASRDGERRKMRARIRE